MHSYQEIMAEQERQRRLEAERRAKRAQQDRESGLSALWQIATASQTLAEQAIKKAESAEKTALFSKIVAIISAVTAVASVIVSIISLVTR